MNIMDVVAWKFNYQEGMVQVDGVLTEFPGGIPSQADQDKWTAEYEAHIDSTQYQRDRKEEYDKLNQFEMQFDDQRDGTTTWVDVIKAIKAKYPKE